MGVTSAPAADLAAEPLEIVLLQHLRRGRREPRVAVRRGVRDVFAHQPAGKRRKLRVGAVQVQSKLPFKGHAVGVSK